MFFTLLCFCVFLRELPAQTKFSTHADSRLKSRINKIIFASIFSLFCFGLEIFTNSINIITNSSLFQHSMEPVGNAFQYIEEDRLLAEKLAKDDNDQQHEDCSQDLLLAQLLQKQFDFEHNTYITREEERLNGHSKVGISLQKFKKHNATPNAPDSTDDEQESYGNSKTSNAAWDVFEEDELERRGTHLRRSGFAIDRHGNMLTKHDIPTSSRRNMRKLMEMKTEIDTGDAGKSKDDLKITNYVYNRLKVHSNRSSKRTSQRAFEQAERDKVLLSSDIESLKLSENTKTIINGLLNSGKVDKLYGVIGAGKESSVIHAFGKTSDINSGEVAIKIFNANLSFKTRDSYNKSKCPSFKFDKPRTRVDSLNKWAEAGYKNLKALQRANIKCPEAVLLKRNVLIMTFIGDEGKPAPQLRHATLSKDELQCAYKQTIKMMTDLYEINFVHSDFSEYNLLWWNDEVYVIDVAQMVSRSHPNANKFLLRDCCNLVNFFKKSGLDEVDDSKQLFSTICGKDLTSKDIEFWSNVEDFPSNEKQMADSRNSSENQFDKTDTFNNLFNHTKDPDKNILVRHNQENVNKELCKLGNEDELVLNNTIEPEKVIIEDDKRRAQ